MRRFFPGVLTLLFAVVGSAQAQITLIPRPPHSVSLSPQYVAMADVDKDGYQDLVVTSDREDKVTVLLGSGGATFRSAFAIAVGQRVGRVAVGDLDGDTYPDIVTIDYNRRRFYAIFNRGATAPGNFEAPVPFDIREVDARANQVRPIDVAIGRFKTLKVGNPPETLNDLGFVGRDYGGRRTDRIVMVRSKAGRDFEANSPVPFAVGDRPRRILLHDLNGDGFDDAMVLNTGDGNADDVSVLLNKAIPQGDFQFPPINYVVGVQAADMAIGDFNGDKIPDLVVVNGERRGVHRNEFSVSVLINRTRVIEGKLTGTGQFDIIAPTDRVSCPTTLAGIPILCTPTSITTGDFDDDGRDDYAISFGTAAINAADGRTVGLVLAKAGLGNGTFDLSTAVSVGLDPGQIVAGDFNGDGVPDIGVAEQTSKVVRILESVPPPPRANGRPCLVGKSCISGNCVDGVCCATASCPNGERCSIPGHEGTCSAPNQNGGECREGSDCASGNCVDNFCCEQRSCPVGQFCNSGECAPPAGNGVPCNQDAQCASGHCTDGVCCSDARCPANESCNVPGFLGMCHAKLPNGDACTDDRQCDSTFCTEGVCCEVEQCQEGFSCALLNREGRCVAKPTPTATRTFTSTPTLTPTPAPIGRPCLENQHCISNFCVDNTCCESPVCPQFQRCDITGSEGMCKPQVPEGAQCGKDSDCLTENCVNGNPPVCGPRKTPTPTPTQTPKAPGQPCASTSQCEAGYFCELEERVCCDQLDCPTGSSCRIPGSLGSCAVMTPTATPKRQLGVPCSSGTQCASTFCTDTVCCDDETCPQGQRCDIAGFAGSCSNPLGVDMSCNKNSDCASGLLCLVTFGGDRRCLPPFTPTEGPPSTRTPTSSPGVTLTTDRSGGCAMDSTPDANAAWLLVSLPLVGWLRRASFSRANVRR